MSAKTGDNSVKPTTGTGFQIPGWIGAGVGAAGSFLASCQGGCWQAFPPFSGNQDQRRACLAACANPTIPNQPGPGFTGAGIGNTAALVVAGFVAYQILKK